MRWNRSLIQYEEWIYKINTSILKLTKKIIIINMDKCELWLGEYFRFHMGSHIYNGQIWTCLGFQRRMYKTVR